MVKKQASQKLVDHYARNGAKPDFETERPKKLQNLIRNPKVLRLLGVGFWLLQ